jgi:hypothetical protein
MYRCLRLCMDVTLVLLLRDAVICGRDGFLDATASTFAFCSVVRLVAAALLHTVVIMMQVFRSVARSAAKRTCVAAVRPTVTGQSQQAERGCDAVQRGDHGNDGRTCTHASLTRIIVCMRLVSCCSCRSHPSPHVHPACLSHGLRQGVSTNHARRTPSTSVCSDEMHGRARN